MNLTTLIKDLFKSAAKKIEKAANTKLVTLTAVTGDPSEITTLPPFNRKDPKEVAAMVVLALGRYPKNREECFAMMNDLKGPEPLTNMEKEFIRDRFMDGKDYIMRSYFKGATPENDYTPQRPLRIEVIELSDSFESEGYARLWIPSGGADSPRQVTLRKKNSTGEWFINQHEFLLGNIRIPKSEDKWA